MKNTDKNTDTGKAEDKGKSKSKSTGGNTADRDALVKMARLSRLALTVGEEALFAQEMSSILGHFQKINAFVEKDMSPMVHPLKEVVTLREDVIQQEMQTREALKNASQRQDTFFKVPPVRKKKT